MENLPDYSDTAGGWASEEKIEIRGWDGSGEPQFTDDTIGFNGNEHQMVDGEEQNLSHETFRLDRTYHPESWERPEKEGGYGQFCKTARKPYDLLVCGVLILLKYYFPKSEVSSDGNYEDWKAARIWYQVTFPDRQLPENGPWQENFYEEES